MAPMATPGNTSMIVSIHFWWYCIGFGDIRLLINHYAYDEYLRAGSNFVVHFCIALINTMDEQYIDS